MDELQGRIELAARKLGKADAIIVGAGAGLTASAGLDYAGEDFRREFADYIEKFGFSDLYSSGFYSFATEEERWAYWARHVKFTRYDPQPLPLYLALKRLLEDRNYFILTTNVDGQFYKAGFDPQRIFAVQGDYAEMQCARACHARVYDNAAAVADILAHSHDLTVSAQHVPKCPVCGGPMDMHLRKDEFFIEDENWHHMADNYERFLDANATKRLALLEIGVGFNTPSIIRYPFDAIAKVSYRAFLIRINQNNAETPNLPAYNSVSFQTDAGFVLNRLLACVMPASTP